MRWTMMLALLLLAMATVGVYAQAETKPAPETTAEEKAKAAEKAAADKAKADADAKAAAERKAKEEKEATEDVGLTATKGDLTDFIKKYLPGVDPAGAHDFTKIQSPTDPQKRFEYTHQMGRLLQFYVKQLDMGATFSKHFDALSRTELKDQPVFMTLYAMLLISFPPGRPNVLEAEDLLKNAAKVADNYEYPNYLLARILMARHGNRRPLMEYVERTLKLRPTFVDAKLLKAEILLDPDAGDTAAAIKLIEETLALDNTDVEDFVQATQLYAIATSTDQLVAKVEELLKRPSLEARRRAHARAVAAQVLAQAGKIQESLPWMDAAIQDIDTKQDPRFAIIARHFLGKANADLAIQLRQRDPKLTGENRKAYELLVLTAKNYYELAATYEKDLLPADMRGEHAEHYVIFLDVSLEEPELAVKWLTDYLDKTTLSGNWRTRLELVLLSMRARTSSDEAIVVRELKDRREKQDTDGLARALALLAGRVRNGNPPKSGELLNELLELLNYTDRSIVAMAGRLAAEGGLSRGGDDIAKVGEALGRRLEKETECVNDEQVQLHKLMAQALRRLGSRKSEARAVRHLETLFAKVVGRTPDELLSVLMEWLDEDYLEALTKAIKDSDVTVPERLGTSARRDPATVREYLTNLAKALDKAAG
ncbi:MAG: hypothetical protein IT462_00335 [Planctomycetes bacterium]|nr:hypothetical protein [Planctomycetota bacterium]